MNIFSVIILCILALFNGAAFVMSIMSKNPDVYSKLMLCFTLPVAVGCVMMLFKRKQGFTAAALGLLVMILGAYLREEATTIPFFIQLILLLLSVYLPKNGVPLWKEWK